jgi:hypothetical protein
MSDDPSKRLNSTVPPTRGTDAYDAPTIIGKASDELIALLRAAESGQKIAPPEADETTAVVPPAPTVSVVLDDPPAPALLAVVAAPAAPALEDTVRPKRVSAGSKKTVPVAIALVVALALVIALVVMRR